MKQFFLSAVAFMVALVASTTVQAQEQVSVANDVTLRSDGANADKAFPSYDAIEMYTQRTDGAITKDFVGLMSFELPEKVGQKISKATLRLVTERAKGSINIYGLNAAVSDKDTYNSQKDNITAARATTPLASLKLAGTSGKAVTDAGVSATLSEWVNEIDLTAYAKKIGSGTMALLLENAANSTTTSVKVFSSDAKDVTNSKVDPNFTFYADDLKPVLTLEYEETAERTITVGNYKISTEKTYVFTAGTKNSDNTFSEQLVDDKALALTAAESNVKYNNLSYAAPQAWQIEYAGEQTVSTSDTKTETVQAFYLKNVDTQKYLNITVKDAGAGTYNGYPGFSDSKDDNSMFYFVADGGSKDMLHIRTVVQMKGASNYTARNLGHNTHKDGQNVAADANSGSANMWIATEVLPITIGSTGLVTFCPITTGVTFDGRTDVTAYKATVSGTDVTLTSISEAAATEGMLIAADANTTVYVAAKADATENTDNKFVGTTEAKTITATDGTTTNYVLSVNNGVAGFYTAKAAGTEVAAGKAYLPVAGAGAKSFGIAYNTTIDLAGSATGINSLEREQADGAYYTLQGIRVERPTSGIYIHNGRKVVIK